MQQNGQDINDIVKKTSEERREEMIILLRAAFGDLKVLSTSGMDLPTLMEYASILKEMESMFSSIDTSNTYDIARICCKSLKISMYLVFFINGTKLPTRFYTRQVGLLLY